MIVVYATIVINLLIIWFMPKRISKVEIYVTWGLLVAINASTDVLLAVVLDLFDYGTSEKVGWQEYVAELFISPSFGILFMNFMPENQRKFLLYLAGWIAFSLLFEWVTVKTHYMTYKGWKQWYSAIGFLLTFLFLRWHLHFLRRNRL